MKEGKMIVIGLDGASWNLIGEWVKADELPNIKKLKQSGCWGPLESCIPPVTFPAWKCYSTGKNPGKLGVFWWQHLDLENKRVITPNSSCFHGKELWFYLNECGFRTGIVGMPTTYPPQPVRGFMISGGADSSDSNYTYPKDLEHYLEKELDYKIHPSITISGAKTKGKITREILELINLRFKAANRLLEKEPVDFLQVTVFYSNLLQHYFYNGEPVKRAWKQIDKQIGALINRFDYIVLMSDHGTDPMIKKFLINSWLEREKYLVRKKTFSDNLFDVGIDRTRLEPFLAGFGFLKKALKKFKIAQKIWESIPTEEGLFGDRAGEGTLIRIDWEKTRVIGSPQGPLYINKKILENENEYERIREELIHKLERLKDPETGKNVIQKVYKREEAYSGNYVKNAPDLIALDSAEYHNRGGIGKKDIFEKGQWKGNNARNGLFVISGPGIEEGRFIGNAKIFDLAPTILHILGCKVPKDIDGRVLKEIWAEWRKS